MPDIPTNSREFRKAEITRNADQVRNLFQLLRSDKKSDNEAVMLAATSAMAGLLGLIVGMADDISRVRELLQAQEDRKTTPEVFQTIGVNKSGD